MKLERPGRVVIISSPSGGGKTSICRKLLSDVRKRRGWQFSISYTTRQKRKGEKTGREYHFVTDKQFEKLVAKNFFSEHFRVHLYKYGTPRKPLESVLNRGGVMLLDVDVQGAAALRRKYSRAISIFVLPPSVGELQKRLKQRGTETKEQLQIRFKKAKEEMQAYKFFQYTIINKKLTDAVKQALAIINAHPCRTENLNSEQIKKFVG